MIGRIASILLLLSTGLVAAAEPPSFVFKRNGVTIEGATPGARLVWLALTREREGHHGKLSADRGVAVVTGNGSVVITGPGADKSRSLWLFADLSGDFVVPAAPPGFTVSSFPIEAQAVAGEDHITVTSPFVDLVYVRRGGGAWAIGASDGGSNDADGSQNTRIVLTLSRLDRFHGGGEPLRQVAAGDIILMIDRFSNRMTSLEVPR